VLWRQDLLHCQIIIFFVVALMIRVILCIPPCSWFLTIDGIGNRNIPTHAHRLFHYRFLLHYPQKAKP